MIEMPKDIFADVPSKCKECNHNTTKWLIDHDKQIRDEVIEQLQKDTSITLRALATELMKNQKNYSEDTCHYFSKGIQAFVIHIEKFIAEQMKGEQDE